MLLLCERNRVSSGRCKNPPTTFQNLHTDQAKNSPFCCWIIDACGNNNHLQTLAVSATCRCGAGGYLLLLVLVRLLQGWSSLSLVIPCFLGGDARRTPVLERHDM